MIIKTKYATIHTFAKILVWIAAIINDRVSLWCKDFVTP